MRRYLFATILVTLSVGAVSHASTVFHFSLVRSVPAHNQKLEVVPTRVQIWFSQVPAAVVSRLALKRGDTDIALGKTIVSDKDKSMYADPVKPLEAGAYTLTWRAAGDDGHAMSGELKFSIVPKSPR